MFTVVIAEKEHLDQIRDNSTFLSPFLKSGDLAFCQWLPEEKTIRDCIPTLEQTVLRRDRWRALIITTDEGVGRHNPFDLVDYNPPLRELDRAPMAEPKANKPTGKAAEMDLMEITDVESKVLDTRLNEYLTKLQAAKFAAYEQAAKKPLTRLVTALCQPPMITQGINRASSDPEFNEYLQEQYKKQELRAGILAGPKLTITLPAEVLCVARRTCENQAYDIPSAWVPHVDMHYSRFGDRNLYFDKMRFFVYDILPRSHQNYAYEYLRFLYSVLILAGHELQSGQARSGIVYRLDCDNDQDALDRLLSGYVAKLTSTEQVVQGRIEELKGRVKERLSDQQASSIFCGNVLIPVTPDREIRQQDLFAKPGFGLSRDCAQDEYGVWHEQCRSTQKTLRQFLKQPRRALRRASDDMRLMNEADSEKALLLNEFQIEDIREHISAEELRMVSIDAPNLYDVTQYESRLREKDDAVRDIIDTRMSRRASVALGLTVLLLFLIGFLPGIFENARNVGNVLTALLVTAASLALLALLCWLFLLGLRRILNRGVRDYNRTMGGIQGEINNSMLQYSSYLSRACNVMRGYSTLNFRRNNEPSDTREIRVLRKHLCDIEAVKTTLLDTFGRYITGKYPTDGLEVLPYDYDFTRTVEFPYPMPCGEAEARRIEYLEHGNYITLPVSYVRSLTLRREELYDKAPVADN